MMHKIQLHGMGSRFEDATLANFELPNGNTEIIFDWLKREKGVLIFSGNPGIGKTHLCAAILNDWITDPYQCRYYNIRSFLHRIKEDIAKNWDYIQTVKSLCECKWFLLDDLGSNSTMTEWQKEVIFEFIDCRYESKLPTLITTNWTKQEIFDNLGKRISSRLKDSNNIIIELDWIDKRLPENQIEGA